MATKNHTMRAQAVEAGGEEYWRQFLIELLIDAATSADKTHPGVKVVANHARERFPDDDEIQKLAAKLTRKRRAH